MTAQIARSGSQMRLEVTDSSHVGQCRREAQRLADAWHFDATSAGRVAIVATELATNLVRHGGGGELLVQPVADGPATQLELLAIDRGPGMGSLQTSLRDGHSTKGSAGTGLGAVSRLSAVFDAYSRAGAGTGVLSRVAARSRTTRRPQDLELGTISVAVRGEPVCGDAWSIACQDGRQALLLVDGLGHGILAAAAATVAVTAFGERPFAEPEDAMRELHRQLNGTRGAAGACAILDPEK
ncbi:MAG TPA: ATP-binding protein, partial [Steroidobacteraceae bacterium]|nr:ATP-binding protein [Steroidobacteraceae bacterium]